MNKINFIYKENITAHNSERRNDLFHTPIESIFDQAGISYDSHTINECIDKQIKGCIYITSDLCRLLNDEKFSSCFNDLICDRVKYALQLNLLYLVIFDTSSLRESESSSKYIYRLKNFLVKNKIDSKNCFIVSNNKIESPYKIYDWELFEYAIFLLFKTQNININLDKKLKAPPKYRFLCLNAKPRFHRYLLMYNFLQKCKNFDQQFNYSLRSIPIDDMVKNLKRYQQDLFFEYIDGKKLLRFLPLLKRLPAYIKEEGSISNTHLWSQISLLKQSLNNAGINIVTETTLTNSGRIFLTEKTFRPIAAKMPFIICGQAGSVKRLHELGYRTFSDFWDESYDEEEDANKRIDKITNCVKELSEMSDNNFLKLLNNTRPIIEYNYNHLFKTRKELEFNKLMSIVSGSK